jgi:carboxymethylenebutenolidase
MGQMIEFTRADGSSVPGYLAEASDANAPGVVVLQEWWGLRAPKSQMIEVCDRLAAAGYRALSPDLYRGKEADNPEDANKLLTSLDWGGAVQDIKGAVAFLKQNGSKAGILGFCMGGALTILSAVNAPEADAAVCFYGIPPAEAADPSKLTKPFLGHFATHDDWCNTKTVGQLETSLQAGAAPFTLHRYEAHHAFCNDKRPDVYDAKSAQIAWDRTFTFLARTLS